MRVPVAWLREIVGAAALPETKDGEQVAADLVRIGLEEEAIHGGQVRGPLVVGKVLTVADEPQKNGKVIRWCTVDVGEHGQRLTEGKAQEIVCGAHNFSAGDLVVVVLPGGVLPGGFEIGARKTYGHVSHGMICAEDELGLGEDHEGIIVLTDYLADQPGKLARAVPGADAIELLGLDEQVVEVNVTPDRGYCLSMRGIAREYELAAGAPITDPAAGPAARVPGDNDAGFGVELVDEAPIHGNLGCDRYVARVVRGVDPAAATPSWMAARLTQAGMRPISLTVDITNYVMLLLGQPLHAFDLDRLTGPVVVRRARPGERITTLDGVDRRLSRQDLLITDAGETPLVIAGVMGGTEAEVTGSTTNVLIEAAHFDPVSVARSSRRHKLSSESSKRFERGTDPALAPAAAQLAAEMMAEFGGGTIDPGVTDAGDRSSLGRITAPFTMPVTEPARLVGLPWTAEEIVSVLGRLGAAVAEAGHDEDGTALLSITPPSWRPDLRTGADVAEELARLRGYDAIASLMPASPGGRGLSPAQRLRRLACDTAAISGYVEVLSYPFTGPERADQLQIPGDDPRRLARRLANPLRAEAPLLRTSLLATTVEVAARNIARGARSVAVFECGLVVLGGGEDVKAPVPPVGEHPPAHVLAEIARAVPGQPRHIAFVAAGDAVPASPSGPARPYEAGDVIATVLELGRALGVELTVTAAGYAPFHPGRCAQVLLADGTGAGYAGELAPRVCAALGLPPRTCAAEVDLDCLIAAAQARRVQAVKLSTLPIATTDVALVVAEDVPAARVEQALRAGAGPLLEELTLFDVFRGEQAGAGSKSLAYRMTFRPVARTLTTAQVSALRDEAVAAAGRATGAVQRA